MPNAVAGVASIVFGLRGPSVTNAAACASGNYAICEAAAKIRAEMVDAMLVIGAEAMATPFMIASFDRMKALSGSNSRRASKPFGKNRTGFVMGEGGGAVVLADLRWAEQKGLPILAEIMGFAAKSGASDIVQPSADGAADCMELALHDARLSSSAIGYVNTHGTATSIGDKVEAEAIWETFVADTYVQPPPLPIINSTKALLGHTLGAAGVLELIVCVESVRRDTVHPMGEYVLDPTCLKPFGDNPRDPFSSVLPITTGKVTGKSIDVAMSNSFGFGDHNAVVIVGKVK
jgi:3-oxoacyl-[acyl-carrier-protein] synthase II